MSKEITIPHPKGDLSIKIPKGLELIKPLRLKGKGYVTQNRVGDYYVKLNVVNDEITDEIRNEFMEHLKTD